MGEILPLPKSRVFRKGLFSSTHWWQGLSLTDLCQLSGVELDSGKQQGFAKTELDNLKIDEPL